MGRCFKVNLLAGEKNNSRTRKLAMVERNTEGAQEPRNIGFRRSASGDR
jgi:hypothetical protein